MGARLRGARRRPAAAARGARRRARADRLRAAARSAQVASCVLLAGLVGAGHDRRSTLPGPRATTPSACSPAFGVPVERSSRGGRRARASRCGVRRGSRACSLRVPGDFSAAAFFLAAAAAAPGAAVTAQGVEPQSHPHRVSSTCSRRWGAGVERTPVRDRGRRADRRRHRDRPGAAARLRRSAPSGAPR